MMDENNISSSSISSYLFLKALSYPRKLSNGLSVHLLHIFFSTSDVSYAWLYHA
jgi:hypothetical protein